MFEKILRWFCNFAAKPLEKAFEWLIGTNFTMFFQPEKLFGMESFMADIGSHIALFSLFLLTCKLLCKFLNVYLFEIDGDSSVPPIFYLKRFAKGVAIILCCTIVYDWIFSIAKDLADRILDVLKFHNFSNGTTSTAVFFCVLLYWIIFICSSFSIFMNGCRMFFLRCSLPLTASGVIESDNGMFNIYVKKIIQTVSTMVAQIALLMVSTVPMTATVGIIPNTLAPLFGIALAIYSSKVAKDLNEMFMISAASGMGHTAAGVARGATTAVSTVVRAFKR